jgi:hypothetical protein
MRLVLVQLLDLVVHLLKSLMCLLVETRLHYQAGLDLIIQCQCYVRFQRRSRALGKSQQLHQFDLMGS